MRNMLRCRSDVGDVRFTLTFELESYFRTFSVSLVVLWSHGWQRESLRSLYRAHIITSRN